MSTAAAIVALTLATLLLFTQQFCGLCKDSAGYPNSFIYLWNLVIQFIFAIVLMVNAPLYMVASCKSGGHITAAVFLFALLATFIVGVVMGTRDFQAARTAKICKITKTELDSDTRPRY
ncbi:PREDICTED: uncharacterized protein LOC106805595 isoform X2 [Priapulus caudatus]|nr:PREDICTED: uncharacterized protein LOC106805595 isoform X2 [Priapulus caudatus]